MPWRPVVLQRDSRTAYGATTARAVVACANELLTPNLE